MGEFGACEALTLSSRLDNIVQEPKTRNEILQPIQSW